MFLRSIPGCLSAKFFVRCKWACEREIMVWTNLQRSLLSTSVLLQGRHDTRHNDIQPIDTQHNDIQHNDTEHNNAKGKQNFLCCLYFKLITLESQPLSLCLPVYLPSCLTASLPTHSPASLTAFLT